LEAIVVDFEAEEKSQNVKTLPAQDLYVSDTDIRFMLEVTRYTRQSNASRVKKIHESLEKRLNRLVRKESEREQREKQYWNNQWVWSENANKVASLNNKAFQKFQEIEWKFKNNYPTRFTSNEAIQATKMLFTVNLETAKKFLNPNSRLFHKYKYGLGKNTSKIAREYYQTAKEIYNFTAGFADGAYLTTANFVNGSMSLLKSSFYAFNNPEKTIEKVWNTISSLNPEAIARSIQHGITKNYEKLVNGTARERGEVVGAIATDILLASTGASYLSNFSKFASGVGKGIVNRVHHLSEIGKFVSNDIGAIGKLNELVESMNRSKNSKLWSSSKYKTASENAYRHYKSHGKDFGVSNAVEYVDRAHQFRKNPPAGVLSKTKENGNIIMYDQGTNTFASFSSEGVPRTMFKPKAGLEYFKRQK
jgi:LysM repeat protein